MPGYPEIKLVIAPYRKLRRVLDTYKPDALHISVEGPLGLAARRYARARKIHYTTAYHTRFPEYAQIYAKVPLALTYGFARWFHNGASSVMVAADSLKNDLEKWGIKNMVIWPRGVDTDLFSPDKKRILPEKGPIFMYMGRVAPEKNIGAFLALNL